MERPAKRRKGSAQEKDCSRKILTSELQIRSDAFLAEFTDNDGFLDPRLQIASQDDGLSVVAKCGISAGAELARCPVKYAVTAFAARAALSDLSLRLDDLDSSAISVLYIGLSRRAALESKDVLLKHRHYVRLLPSPDQLRTPLWWSEEERALLTGTNLFHTTLQREALWRDEWQHCLLALANSSLKDIDYTWEDHLWARTMFSSRSFPPSLAGLDESSGPVLFPGIDLFNHKRRQPVEWRTSTDQEKKASFTLVTCTALEEGGWVYNNYGGKPNEELLLGYGFVLEDNPEDQVTLKLKPENLLLKSDEGRFSLSRQVSVSPGLTALFAEITCVQPHVNAEIFVLRYEEIHEDAFHDPSTLLPFDERCDSTSVLGLVQCEARAYLQDMLWARLEKIPEFDWDAMHSNDPASVINMARTYSTVQRQILRDTIEELQKERRKLHKARKPEIRCDCFELDWILAYAE